MLWFAVLVVVLSPITAAAVARITGDEAIPAMQIATIADLLEGELPKLPPQEIGGGCKQAPKEQIGKQEKLSLIWPLPQSNWPTTRAR